MGAIERYFDHMTSREWGPLAAVLASAVERVGPFGDIVVGRDRYVDLLRTVVPEAYGNDVHRVTYAPDGRAGLRAARR